MAATPLDCETRMAEQTEIPHPASEPSALESRLEQLEALAERLSLRLSALQAERVAQRQQADALRQEIAEAQGRWAVEAMHAAGLAAQATHLLAMGPEAAVAESEAAYADGSPKSRLAVIYEQAFDARGRELGIDDPASFRAG